MKTLYLECSMGAAGDMLMAALLELLPDGESALRELNTLKIPNVKIERESAVRCGIVGTHMRVFAHGAEEASICHEHAHEHAHEHEHERGHHHAGMAEIEKIIDGIAVSDRVKADAAAVYRLLADAEARAHGRPVTEIHFHEVGTLDAVADIVGVCWLMEKLAPDCVLASPVATGYGTVRCAHGVLPVPAPAAAYLLEGVPNYAGEVEGELCTPTGAALLKYFVTEFCSRPMMRVEKIGCGMGAREFGSHANCVRAFWGDGGERPDGDTVAELHCTVDDMTGEEIAFATEELLSAGALDVFTTPVMMKKGRPGHDIACIVKPEEAETFAALMLRHTTSWGVRRRDCIRYVMTKENRTVQTPFGPMSVKQGEGYGTEKDKAEYEDAARIAREKGLPLRTVTRMTSRE